MRNDDSILARWNRNLFMGSAEFFVFLFVYIWLRIRPELIYNGFGTFFRAPLFRFGWLFFENHLGCPGRLVEYVSGFLSQCYYYSWLGALIITAVAWGLVHCTAALLVAVEKTARYRLIICCIPAILLLVVYNGYVHPLTTCLALLTGLGFSVVYERIAPQSNPVRVVLFAVMLLVLYYIAAGASLIFLVLVVIHEILTARRIGIGLLYLFIGLAVPWLVGIRLIGMEPVSAYLYLLPFNPGYPSKAKFFIYGLWLFVPVVKLLTELRLDLTSPEAGKAPQAESGLRMRVLFIIAIVVCILTFDSGRKTVLQMNYFSRHKMWPQLLQTAGRIKSYSSYSIHDIDRALYHTGRLGEEMFSYPQKVEALFFAGPKVTELQYISSSWFLKLAEIFLELGHVNYAEHLTCELLEEHGPWPIYLKKLALMSMVKGDIQGARAFLKVLSKDLVCTRQAKKALARLGSDPQLESDSEVQHIRSIMCADDYAVVDYGGEWMLLELMKTNRQNQMAFEYLMAHYLLTRELHKFLDNLPRLDDFGYEEIPRHYQEAILIYAAVAQSPIDLGNRRIDDEVKQNYRKFESVCLAYKHDKAAARRMLAPEFGRSYFFYFTFGTSGVEK